MMRVVQQPNQNPFGRRPGARTPPILFILAIASRPQTVEDDGDNAMLAARVLDAASREQGGTGRSAWVTSPQAISRAEVEVTRSAALRDTQSA